MNEHKIHFCIDALAADTADKISRKYCISTTGALQKLMKSKTYLLLFDEQSLLYLESAEYIFDMFQAEQRGDWAYWKEE